MKLFLQILVVLFFVSPAVVRAQKVAVDYDKTVNFSKYKTYAWSQGKGARNPLIDQMILTGVEQQLSAKGLTKVDANPDLVVAYMAAVGFDIQVAQPSWSNAAMPLYMGITSTGQMWNVSVGSLIVDLVDKKSDQMVWRGTATETLPHGPTNNQAADAKSVAKPVRNCLAKMFKKYPVSDSK